MQKPMKNILEVIILCTVAAVLLMVFQETEANGKRIDYIEKLAITGTIYSEGEAVDITGSDFPDLLEDQPSVRIDGHFTEDITKGTSILLRLNNLGCTVRLNGQVIYQSHSADSFLHAPGNGWESFVTSGISKQDKIEITLTKMDSSSDNGEYTEFLTELSLGSDKALLSSLLRQSGLSLVFHLFILTAGMVSFFVATSLGLMKTPNVKRSLAFSLFVIACGTWFVIRNPAMLFLTGKPVFNHVADVLSQYFISIFALSYAAEYVTKKRKNILGCCEIVAIGFSVTAILLQKFTAVGFYDLMEAGVCLNVLFLLIISACFGYELIYLGNKEIRYFLLSAIPALVGGFAEIINYLFFDRYGSTILFSLGFSVFMILQFTYCILEFKKNAELAEKSEKLKNELIQSRISIMLSQIQPHFLFNSLASIRYLCRKDPQQAEVIIGEFASFLRGNLENLNTVRRIPFIQELNHLKHFLEIEKVCYEDKLCIVYDIQIEEFELPSLTVQPMVENAVRYGIGRKPDQGTVTISSAETEHCYLITVVDDGIGFDPEQMPQDGRTHVGIQNVRQRLEQQCGGRLEIKSTLGEGTKVSIFIPKKNNEPSQH